MGSMIVARYRVGTLADLAAGYFKEYKLKHIVVKFAQYAVVGRPFTSDAVSTL